MWLVIAYVVSVIIIFIMVFNDFKKRKRNERYISVLWMLVGLIPVYNTFMALLMVALWTSGYFMSKMVNGLLEKDEDEQTKK